MTLSEIPREKYEAYRKAEYRFVYCTKLITVRTGEVSAELLKIYSEISLSSGVFITAYNPFGRRRSTSENDTANKRLLLDLGKLTSYITDGEWVDSSSDWSIEKSFFAFGVSLDTANDLGRQYQQDALVWTGPDAFTHLVLLR